jgi:hypothetical protein
MERLHDGLQTSYSAAGPLKNNPPPAGTGSEEPFAGHDDSVAFGGANTPERQHWVRNQHFAVHDAMETIHVGTEISQALKLTGGLAAAPGLGTIVSGIYFGYEGLKDMSSAVRERDVIGGIESAGHLSLASEAVIDTARWATHSSAVRNALGPETSSFMASPGVKLLGQVFGVGHGLAEVAVGAKEVVDGKKAHSKKKIISGLLNMAIGGTVAALAFVPGVPGAIALAALFATKMFLTHRAGSD